MPVAAKNPYFLDEKSCAPAPPNAARLPVVRRPRSIVGPGSWQATLPQSSLRGLRRLDRGADRAAHAGAAQPAIAHRILGEVLLMIVLGEVERRRVENFGRDRVETPGLQRLVVPRLRRLGGLALGGGEGIDAGAVLRAGIVALAHALGGIVALPERLQQVFIGDPLRVIDHYHDLVVAGLAAADLVVRRIGSMAGGIADGGDVDAV